MIAVDTTVWIDFFAAKATPEAEELERQIREGDDVCTCGLILAEVLQGIREDKTYRRIRSRFEDLVFLPMGRDDFIKAADIYRSLRRKGITIRKPIDCMIAAVCIAHDVPLLHNDRDFLPMEKHCGLKTIKAR
ncbi:MAG: hypothetical protein QG656_129 [Candidatus Hydrogenedentes bacterium]|nr:hypothetical protein [Candidatus Hydrogenedentota bacterium]